MDLKEGKEWQKCFNVLKRMEKMTYYKIKQECLSMKKKVNSERANVVR